MCVSFFPLECSYYHGHATVVDLMVPGHPSIVMGTSDEGERFNLTPFDCTLSIFQFFVYQIVSINEPKFEYY